MPALRRFRGKAGRIFTVGKPSRLYVFSAPFVLVVPLDFTI